MSSSSVILQNNENITFVSNPSITYFKSVYRKHTKFSIGYYETGTALNYFDETTSKIIIPFDVTADLLCDISLKVQFKVPGALFRPPDDIALHLIKDITFNLQGHINEFDKLDKEYINFNAMLNNHNSSKATYTLTPTGKLTCNNGNNFQNMALCGGIGGEWGERALDADTAIGGLDNIKSMDAIIPLPFAFSKSIGTAIPLCAFNQTTTTPQIVITAVPLDRIDFGQGSDKEEIMGSFTYSAISKYIFLSNEEITRFKTTRSEYLYERVNSFITKKTTGGPINISRLNKKNPIKQIFIHVGSDDEDKEILHTLEYNMSINNEGMFSENFSHEFFSKVEILNKFKGYISQYTRSLSIGIIDFSLKNTQGPSGCVSPSDNNIILNIKKSSSGKSFDITIYTVCYYILRISDGELTHVFN